MSLELLRNSWRTHANIAGVTRSVLFDVGSVLIGWEVRPPFRPHVSSDKELDACLRGTFREIYHAVHDGDGSMAECLRPVRGRYPELAHLIDIYEHHWADFITGVKEETVAIVRELHARGVTLYGVTNWPAQVWPPQRLMPEQAESFAFLDLFSDIWVSGEHKVRKPDPGELPIGVAAVRRLREGGGLHRRYRGER